MSRLERSVAKSHNVGVVNCNGGVCCVLHRRIRFEGRFWPDLDECVQQDQWVTAICDADLVVLRNSSALM
jgi:hypothetical protein